MLKRLFRVVRRNFLKNWRLLSIKKLGIRYVKPNFIYIPNLSRNSLVIDAGCGYEADFSLHMINQYGLKAFGVDPTHKHRQALIQHEKTYLGKFNYLPFAITAKDTELDFYESKVNESGSICHDHTNVKHDEVIKYKVKGLTLSSILKEINETSVDILKLDLEGAEYELLNNVSKADLLPFKQIFIEFHHHAIAQFNKQDTKRLVNKFVNFGFKKFSLDDHNYLLYRA